MTGLKKEQVAEAHLKLTVKDHNYFWWNELIGIYQVRTTYFPSPSLHYFILHYHILHCVSCLYLNCTLLNCFLPPLFPPSCLLSLFRFSTFCFYIHLTFVFKSVYRLIWFPYTEKGITKYTELGAPFVTQ